MATIAEAADDAIISVLGYHRSTYDLGGIYGYGSVDHFYPSPSISFVPSRLYHPTFEPGTTAPGPSTGLGTLDTLSNEIVIEIVRSMDVGTSLRFRQVNRRALDIVSQQVEFRIVIRHAHACLKTILEGGLARSLTFANIYRALLIPICENCHRLACFIYLPTATKACEECIATHSHFQTVTLSSLSKVVGLSENILRQKLPIMKVLTSQSEVEDPKTEVVNLKEALSVVALQSDLPQPAMYYNQGQKLRYKASIPLPTFSRTTHTTYRHFGCQGCVWYYGVAEAHLYFLLSDDERISRFRECSANYTRVELLEHVKDCEGARDLWGCTKGGTDNQRYTLATKQLIRTRLPKFIA